MEIEVESFKPIQITLNDQDEVDKLFAILNHDYVYQSLVKPSEVSPSGALRKLYEWLRIDKSNGYEKYHYVLDDYIKGQK